jgi:hypothetical protein
MCFSIENEEVLTLQCHLHCSAGRESISEHSNLKKKTPQSWSVFKYELQRYWKCNNKLENT